MALSTYKTKAKNKKKRLQQKQMNKKNDIFFDKDSFFFYVSILNISNEQKDQVYKMRELERGRETIHT